METKRVLIADDEPIFLRAMTIRCRHLGLDVSTASDATETLGAIRTQPPDLLLLDVNMPAGDGLAVCEMIVSDTQLPPVPVIMMTGRSDEETIRRCEELGAHYVLKTEDVWDRLKPIVCKLLGIRGGGAGAVESSAAALSPAQPSLSQPRPKILIIDDDPSFSKALKLKLSAYGIDVRVAFNGMQGYWTALKERPDVIITDLVMPEGYGNYVLRRLKQHALTKAIPVFVVTGRTLPARKDFALERELVGLGAAALFGKPLDFEALLGGLRLHIDFPAHPTSPARKPTGTGPIFC